LSSLSIGAYPIVFAPTGTLPTKSQTAFVPITPKEIGEQVERCAEIGITSVHVHARDPEGNPDWKIDTYKEIVSEIKTRNQDVLINVSTSGRNWTEIEKRADCLALEGDLKPELASLTLSSLNFLSGPSINAPETVYKLAEIMKTRGITPELEIFDLGMVNMISVLSKKGLLDFPLVANLFFGNIAGVQATPSEIGIMVDRLPDKTIWSGAGIGRFRDQVHAISLASGGGVRVGLEDGIYLNDDKKVLATNEQLVERVHRMASFLGREYMKPAEFRSLISARS
jgi:3-keto-5-aminohexanoate cleavage enzyme